MTSPPAARRAETTAVDGEEVTGGVVVIDTSALVADPTVIEAFPQASVVLPLTVIEELDGLKTRADAVGANARNVIRTLEAVRREGTLLDAATLPGGGTLRVEPNGLRLEELKPYHLDPTHPDNRIIASALGLAANGQPVTIVSCDGAMRLKADAVGLAARDHTVIDHSWKIEDCPGWRVLTGTGTVQRLYDDKRVPHSELPDLTHNEFAILKDGPNSALARRRGDHVHLLRTGSSPNAWGLQPRNKEQRFALELLTDTEVEVVALAGRAGTGKTLLALAAALEQVFERGEDAAYERLIVLRPMHAIDKQELGFLPGEVSDKVAPWFDALVDALQALSPRYTHQDARDQLAMWSEMGKLAMEPATFLRGRTWSKTIVVVDETQNFEPSGVKTILTRVGNGSKVVLCGDMDQCDNPWTSPKNNGLSAAVSALRDHPSFGHVLLEECERSAVADLAARRM